MTLDGLRCFCAIVEAGNFRAAAMAVHRSQPAVSQQLRVLEHEAGHRLIDRKRGLPTPLGGLLYARACQILHSVDALGREVAEFDMEIGHELRVGASDTTALHALPSVVKRFSGVAPHTRLVLVNRNSDAIAQQVLQGSLDLGIVTLPQHHAELNEEELFHQRLVLAVPARHALAKKRGIKLSDLAGEPLLLLDAQTRTGALLRSYFHEQRFEPQVKLDSGSFEVIKRYIAEGIGLSFVPESVASPSDNRIATRRLPGLPSVPIGVIWRKDAYRSKAANVFLELLRNTQGG